MGKTVGIPQPHPGQLHQAAHLRVPQLCFQGEARHVPAQQGFLRRPLGVQLLHKTTARCGQTGRQACFRHCRCCGLCRRFRLLCFPGFFCHCFPRRLRRGLCLRCFHRARRNGLLLLGAAQRRSRSRRWGGTALPLRKQLQVHHALLPAAAQVRKAHVVRVALCQQGKTCLGKFKCSLHPGLPRGSRCHGQARALRLVPGIAFGTFLPGQQIDQRLHQGACPGAHDVLPGRGIARMARRFQPEGRAAGAVQFGIGHFDHETAPFIALAAAAVLRFSPGPLRGPCFNCTSWLCSCSSRWASVPFWRTRWRTFSMPSKSIISSAANAASAFRGAKNPSW